MIGKLAKWQGTRLGTIYSLKLSSNGRGLTNFSWQFDLLFEFLLEHYWKEDTRRNIFFHNLYCSWCLTWVLNHGFMSDKSIHYLLLAKARILTCLLNFLPFQRFLSTTVAIKNFWIFGFKFFFLLILFIDLWLNN